jgi:hypothetical protein
MEFHILIKPHPDQSQGFQGRIREDGLAGRLAPAFDNHPNLPGYYPNKSLQEGTRS